MTPEQIDTEMNSTREWLEPVIEGNTTWMGDDWKMMLQFKVSNFLASSINWQERLWLFHIYIEFPRTLDDFVDNLTQRRRYLMSARSQKAILGIIHCFIWTSSELHMRKEVQAECNFGTWWDSLSLLRHVLLRFVQFNCNIIFGGQKTREQEREKSPRKLAKERKRSTSIKK